MKVKFEGGIKDVSLRDVTAENYIVPAGEERSWHVIQEKLEFDRNTGQRLSRPVLQKYDTKIYPATSKYLRDAGYTITVVHDPIKWMQQQQRAAAEIQQQKQKQAEQQAKAEKDAMIAQLRSELKAELKAEMQAEMTAHKEPGNKADTKKTSSKK